MATENNVLTKNYDMVVIGFGKAGKTLAATFGTEGKKVAMIEESPKMYGGTCINIGCIPTKTLVVGADKGKSFEEAKATRDKVVAKLNAKNLGMLENNPNVDVYTAKAHFVDDKVVAFTWDGKTVQVTAPVIIINTGATQNVLSIPGLTTSKHVYNSTEFQAVDKKPNTLGIIGGGNIGLEFANLYARLGVKVTVIETGDRILKREDEDVAALAKTYMEEEGVTFVLGAKTESVSNRGEQVVVKTDQGELLFDALIHATGRKPNTADLGLEHTDIQVKPNGAIEVDEFCQTSVPGVFAVGDVNGGMQFTYVSLDDFRIVNRYLHGDTSYSHKERKNVPYATFITPPLAHVGLHEGEAREKYPHAAVGTLMVNNMPRHAVNQDPRGIFKVIVDTDTKLILGATIFSKGAEEIINLLKMAMDNNIPYTYIQNQIFTHPTMAENLNDVFKNLK